MWLTLRLQVLHWQKLRPLLNVKYISTSNKNRETVPQVQNVCNPSTTNNENWVTYGFNRRNKAEDRFYTSASFFVSITIGIVLSVFGLMYAPDIKLKDWAQREAFIELRRREAAGLPLIDRNLIDPRKIKLPSETELGDTDIII